MERLLSSVSAAVVELYFNNIWLDSNVSLIIAVDEACSKAADDVGVSAKGAKNMCTILKQLVSFHRVFLEG